MDAQLRDVVRSLQVGPYNAATIGQVRQALNAMRAAGKTVELEEQRADLIVLLDDFAEQAETAVDSAAALLLGADLSHLAGAQAHCVERLALALELEPGNDAAATLLVRVLSAPADRERLLALLSARAQALVTSDYVDDAVAAGALSQIGGIHEQARDWNKAIDFYDRALELSPDVSTVERLASLYERRNRAGDVEQAADLYCALYDVLPPDEGLPHVQHALRLVPGHAEARQRLQAARPVGNYGETHVGPAPARPPSASPGPAAGVAAASPASAASATAGAGATTVRPPRASARTKGRVPSKSTAPQSARPTAVSTSPRAQASAAPKAVATPISALPAPAATPTGATQRPHAPTMNMQPALVAQAALPAAVAPAAVPSSRPAPAISHPPAVAASDPSVQLASGDMFSVMSTSLASGRPHRPDSDPGGLAAAAGSKNKKLMAAAVAAAGLLLSVGAYAALRIPDPEPDVTGELQAADGEPATAVGPSQEQAPEPTTLAAVAPSSDEVQEQAPSVEPQEEDEDGDEEELVDETADVEGSDAPVAQAPAAMEPQPAAQAPKVRKRRAQPEVKLLTGAARVRGAKASKKAFVAAIDKRMSRIERCYKAALRRDSDLEGRLVYGFKVKSNGRPLAVKSIGGTIHDKRLDACTRKVLARTHFPKSRKGATATVRVPLRFGK